MNTRILFTALFGFVFFASMSFAQSIDLTIDTRSKLRYSDMQAFRVAITSMDGIQVSPQALVSVAPAIKTSNLKKIEGIETKTVGDGKLIVSIFNTITQSDTVIIFEDKISDPSRSQLDKDIIDKAFNNTAFKYQLMSLLKAYSEDAFSSAACAKYKAIIIAEKEKGHWPTAIQYLKLLNHVDLCASELSSFQKTILDEFTEKECTKILSDANIYIANGSQYYLNKATQLLLSLPPSPKCQQEALATIQSLSAKSNLAAPDKEKLSNYLIILSQNDTGAWMRMGN